MSDLSCSIVIHVEELEGRVVYVAECEELGVSDFGYTPQEAIENLKKALNLLISVEPEKAQALKASQPVMVTRISL